MHVHVKNLESNLSTRLKNQNSKFITTRKCYCLILYQLCSCIKVACTRYKATSIIVFNRRRVYGVEDERDDADSDVGDDDSEADRRRRRRRTGPAC